MNSKIFVYGTLMKEMSNHDCYLSKSKFLGNAEIEGFIMYDLGSYPGIVGGIGRIKGEIYEVSEETLKRIDLLEGEGDLYTKKLISTSLGEAYVYIYNHSIENRTVIPYEMQPYNNLIYYVSYGSNMLEERFLCYIKGGKCRYNNRNYDGCKNKCFPIKSKSIIIPYNMYYSKSSSSWGNKPVSFLNYEIKGFAYARAYLITKEQFEEVQKQEGESWYGKQIELDLIDGFKSYTFTNKDNLIHKHYNSLSDGYKQVLKDGLKESFPNLSGDKIDRYLIKCSE